MFEALGLSADEETVYLALVDRPGSDAGGLQDLGLGASRLRGAIVSLGARGLVSQLPGSPRRYSAAAPEVALEVLVRSREEELQRIRVEAARLGERLREARSHLMRPAEVVEVVTTPEATMQRWIEVQRSARSEVITFDRPPYLTTSVNEVELELLAKGVGYRSVYDRSAFDEPELIAEALEMAARGERNRVASGIPVKMFIADASIGLISLHGATSAENALVVHASSLLDSLVALFEEVWQRAVPLTPAAAEDASLETTPGAGEGVDIGLLSLLAAGLTDEAIAHQRGLHPRTVRRHVRKLLDELGAETRFQAGLQAGRRGLL